MKALFFSGFALNVACAAANYACFGANPSDNSLNLFVGLLNTGVAIFLWSIASEA